MKLSKPTKDKLYSYLMTGELGEYKPGMKYEEMVELMGEPDYFSKQFERDGKWMYATAYQNLFFRVFDGLVIDSLIDYPVKKGFPKQFDVDWLTEVEKITFEEFKVLLKEFNIPCLYVVEPEIRALDRRVVVVDGVNGNQVLIDFTAENNYGIYTLLHDTSPWNEKTQPCKD